MPILRFYLSNSDTQQIMIDTEISTTSFLYEIEMNNEHYYLPCKSRIRLYFKKIGQEVNILVFSFLHIQIISVCLHHCSNKWQTTPHICIWDWKWLLGVDCFYNSVKVNSWFNLLCFISILHLSFELYRHDGHGLTLIKQQC